MPAKAVGRDRRKTCANCVLKGESWIDNDTCNACMGNTMYGKADHPNWRKEETA
jgi:hypothetical protein